MASHHGEKQPQQGWRGRGELCLPQEAAGLALEGIAFSRWGEIFLSPVLSHPCCCFDSCLSLCGDFPAPSQADGKFSAAPSPRPGGDHLQSGLGGAGRCRQVSTLPGLPRAGNDRQRGWGVQGSTDPPSSLPGFDSLPAREGEEGLPSSSGHKSSSVALSCST